MTKLALQKGIVVSFIAFLCLSTTCLAMEDETEEKVHTFKKGGNAVATMRPYKNEDDKHLLTLYLNTIKLANAFIWDKMTYTQVRKSYKQEDPLISLQIKDEQEKLTNNFEVLRLEIERRKLIRTWSPHPE